MCVIVGEVVITGQTSVTEGDSVMVCVMLSNDSVRLATDLTVSLSMDNSANAGLERVQRKPSNMHVARDFTVSWVVMILVCYYIYRH